VSCHFDHLFCQLLLLLLHQCCLHAGSSSQVLLQHRHSYMQPVCADYAATGPVQSADYVPVNEAMIVLWPV
jgi:hypothetical protein